ncbi:MAG: hypothetical protein GY861_26355 [bacterium]|nr:hypothetical protein [bacterium]
MRYRNVLNYYNEDVDINTVIHDTDNLYFVAFDDFELTLLVFYRYSDDEFIFLGEIITDGSFKYEEMYQFYIKHKDIEKPAFERIKDMREFIRSKEHLKFYDKPLSFKYIEPCTHPKNREIALKGQHEVVFDFGNGKPNCMFFGHMNFDTIDQFKIAAEVQEELITALLHHNVKTDREVTRNTFNDL